MRKLSRITILIILVSAFAATATPQGQQAIDSLFYHAVDLYKTGQFQACLNNLRQLDRENSGHARTTASLLMQAKALEKLGSLYRSSDLYHRIIQEHPDSRYKDYARYGMASVAFKQDRFEEAIRFLLQVVESSSDHRLVKIAAQHASDMMDYKLDAAALRLLLDTVTGERSRAAVTVRLAQRDLENQRFQSARQILDDFLATYPESNLRSRMEALLRRARQQGSDVVKIGVILPLSGPMAEQGKALLEGLTFGVDEHNKNVETQIQLTLRDSRGQILDAIKAAQSLCRNPDIMAIIGELDSDMTAAIGAVAQASGVALLAPTATLNGITTLGPSIFQLNSSLEVRAQALADYAVNGLGLQRFAVLAPANPYGESMHNAFVETIRELGGEILAEKWYFEGTKDMRAQFEAMREAGIRRMFTDSTLVYVPEMEFDTFYAEQQVQDGIIYVKQRTPSLVDSTDLAVTSIDGVFLPVMSEDLAYVIPQLAFHNIQAQILGGSSWHQEELLKENSRYVDGAIFVTDYFIDPSDFRFFRFRDAFRAAKGKTPERMELYGYDTARLIDSLTEGAILTRDDVRNALSAMREVVGVRGTISLNDNRVNTSLRILQYRGERLIPIK